MSSFCISSKIDLYFVWGFLDQHLQTHRHTRKHSNAPTTVSVGHYITISNTEEGYSNEPHCVEQICMFLIVISVMMVVFRSSSDDNQIVFGGYRVVVDTCSSQVRGESKMKKEKKKRSTLIQ